MANMNKAENDRSIEIIHYNALLAATYVKIDNITGAFSREYLFGKPASKEIIKYCAFQSSDFDPVTNIYATLTKEKVKGKLKASLAWVTLE